MIVFCLSAYLNNCRILTGLTRTTMALNSVALLLVWMIISTALAGEIFRLFPYGGPSQHSKMKAWYIPFYIFKLTVLSLLYSLQIQFRFSYILEILLGIQVFFVLLLVLGKPYRSAFMAIGAIISELTAVFSLLMALMRKFVTWTEDLDAIMVYVLIGLIGGSTVLTLLRVLRCLYITVFEKETTIIIRKEVPKLAIQKRE